MAYDRYVSILSLLGFVVSMGTLHMDPANIRAMVDWPHPTFLWVLQDFLGFATFSSVAAPLTALTQMT
ncbi:hypothetical protein AOLI_G00300140 [Acnodon oligacanthus]